MAGPSASDNKLQALQEAYSILHHGYVNRPAVDHPDRAGWYKHFLPAVRAFFKRLKDNRIYSIPPLAAGIVVENNRAASRGVDFDAEVVMEVVGPIAGTRFTGMLDSPVLLLPESELRVSWWRHPQNSKFFLLLF